MSTAPVSKGTFAAIYEHEAVFERLIVLDGRPHELWMKGNALMVLLAPTDRGPVRVRELLTSRRTSTLTGRCPLCDAVVDLHDVNGDSPAGHGTMWHEADCEISNENLEALFSRAYGPIKRSWWSRSVWEAAKAEVGE